MPVCHGFRDCYECIGRMYGLVARKNDGARDCRLSMLSANEIYNKRRTFRVCMEIRLWSRRVKEKRIFSRRMLMASKSIAATFRLVNTFSTSVIWWCCVAHHVWNIRIDDFPDRGLQIDHTDFDMSECGPHERILPAKTDIFHTRVSAFFFFFHSSFDDCINIHALNKEI